MQIAWYIACTLFIELNDATSCTDSPWKSYTVYSARFISYLTCGYLVWSIHMLSFGVDIYPVHAEGQCPPSLKFYKWAVGHKFNAPPCDVRHQPIIWSCTENSMSVSGRLNGRTDDVHVVFRSFPLYYKNHHVHHLYSTDSCIYHAIWEFFILFLTLFYKLILNLILFNFFSQN